MNIINDSDILSNFAVNLTYYINKFKNVKAVYYADGIRRCSYSKPFYYKSFNGFCINVNLDVKSVKALITGSVFPRYDTAMKIIDFLHLYDKNITLGSMLSGIIQ